ncbi:MAG: PDDEXK nuclease domain-containing protein [Bacillota bacterium]|nr:PDDEXK nuclease domain-containing protein [Bacillota bacterium]
MAKNELDRSVYDSIKEVLTNAREKAYKAVNFAMVEAYWNVGKLIVEAQDGNERAEYGEELLKDLSKDLTREFGKGFTVTNLRYMRQFYLVFQKHHALRDELSWTHYRLLMKIENAEIRKFYLDECIEQNWSTRQLDRQINSFYYQRILASQNKQIVRNEINKLEKGIQAEDIIKDPFVLEFMGLNDHRDFTEIEVEKALMDNLQKFLLELGKGFSFVARQKRITADGDHFYIDLVFYNYILKCFILIDLKVGKLSHQDIGQMDFYVRYFEKEIKSDSDNPTIGIILSSERNETVVKYSVLEESKQLFSAKYLPYLPTEEELKKELKRERNLIEIEKGLQD